MRMKKLIALLMALAMIFALAACGGGTTPSQAPASQDPGATTSDEGGEPAGEPVTITIAPDHRWQRP